MEKLFNGKKQMLFIKYFLKTFPFIIPGLSFSNSTIVDYNSKIKQLIVISAHKKCIRMDISKMRPI